ncbi:P-loop containing nucleoside triphosphate hydrolase protein [Multifurca ochricompacta]|uniref:Kinesin-like protein n=1 Tax=Multifurca ochricompacta TaxID=376703 RepID=A0AAD4MCU9_9AGAM|nr:P-loop containing nucleoside triphosphate hydrolase protein [Multifurca ochricompacta]
MNTRTKSTAIKASTRTTRATSQLQTSIPAPTRSVRTAIAKSSHVIPAQLSEKKSSAVTKKTDPRVTTATVIPHDIDREPIKAFLRIRPDIAGDGSRRAPYLESLSDTTVRMIDPSRDDPHSYSGIPRFRLSAAPTSTIYTFTHVFPPNAQQPEFFAKTTLPLVRGLLDGEDGLLFAYGVSNSGKTYTMQGGSHESSAGILPRTVDVLFNSIEGLQGSSKYRPARLNGLELNSASSIFSRAPSLDNFALPAQQPALGDILTEHFESPVVSEADHDPTTLKIDRNYEYSIWLSYAEVYNEKIYDLLTNVEGDGGGSSRSQPILLTRKALAMKPAPPSDNPDSDGPVGKYISGLTHVRVNSAKEAKKMITLGQLHRRVFGTLANSQSSRSHGVVTIKLLRKHRGERDEHSFYMTSRLTLIDLAGSERSKNTQATGERLKEAGNINKSLMVLGQCIEVMRANQKRVAQSLGAQNQRSDTRDVKRYLAVVPFRHSKLTEILMDYFTGEGRVTMIININPYDTGFDENSNVMKFSSLARDVTTVAPTQRVLQAGRAKVPATAGNPQSKTPSESHHRKVVISTSGRGERKFSETQLDVVEEDEDIEGESDEEPLNGLVEALFDEIERLQLQLFESEMRGAVVEAEIREEVMREMEGRIREMEKRFARRLMSEVELNEMRMDAKIDMLHRTGLIGKTPSKVGPLEQRSNECNSRAPVSEEPGVDGSSEDDRVNNLTSHRSRAVSPLAGRGKVQAKDLGRSALHSNNETEMGIQENLSPHTEEGEDGFDETDDEGSATTETGSEDPDVWVPASSRPSSTVAIAQNMPSPQLEQAPPPIFEKDVKAGRVRARPSSQMSVSELARDLGDLGLRNERIPRRLTRHTRQSTRTSVAEEEEESIIVVPNAKASDGQKKKKRQLGKKQVYTDESIERATEQLAKSESGRGIRRMGRGSG